MAIFNPEDFIIQDITPPETKKPIIEYDSVNKLVFVRFKKDDGSYVYNSIYLGKELNDKLLSSIPDEWSNDKDTIINFAIFDDGEFYLYKEKYKYDFTTQEARKVKYQSNDFTLEDAKELFNILKSLLFIKQTTTEVEKIDAIVDVLLDNEYLDYRYQQQVDERDNLLRSSDYRILDDYPELFEGEKELWLQWREKLRTIVLAKEEFEDTLDWIIHIESFKWPIDPLIYYQNYPELDVEYLSTEDQFSQQPALVSTELQSKIRKSALTSAYAAYRQQESKIPVDKQIYDIIIKYSLLEDFMSLDINRLEVQ